MKPNWIAIGSFSAAIAVLLGAAGAHMLQGRVSAGDFELWKTGVLYQVIHALGLILFGLFRDGRSSSSVPGWAFFVGSILFSGTLYSHALGAPEELLHVAPIGGLTLIAGWVAFAVCALRSSHRLDGRA